jgi:hypothetical protein
MRRVTKKQIQQDLRALVAAEIKTTFGVLAGVVEQAGTRSGSARHGLEVTAFAFAAVLDAYAKPNAANPEGMCDDPQAFRRYFAEIIARGPVGDVVATCARCGCSKERHRPEAVAHHSECTLEQYTEATP